MALRSLLTVRLRRPRSSWPAITFLTARTWMRPSGGRQRFLRGAVVSKAASRSACCPVFPPPTRNRNWRRAQPLAMDELRNTIESLFRQESGRILATLIRISGSFDLAEEAMQEAFATAVSHWPAKGVPGNPGAWITSVAHRKLVDHSRRERTRREKQGPLLYETPTTYEPDMTMLEAEPITFPDDRLRLIF